MNINSDSLDYKILLMEVEFSQKKKQTKRKKENDHKNYRINLKFYFSSTKINLTAY